MVTKRNLAWVSGAVIVCAGWSPPAGAQDAALQQKLVAARESAARNQEALRKYSWMSQTQVSFKGEVRNTRVESCQYGPDGRVMKTPLTAPPPEEHKRGLRGRVVERKKEEMKEEMESASALIQTYVPPHPDKIQAAIAASKVSLTPGPGLVTITLKDYNKPGDSMTLTFESEVKALRKIGVASFLDDPSQAIALEVDLQSLPDGTSYPAVEQLSIPASHIDVRIENSNYQKIGN